MLNHGLAAGYVEALIGIAPGRMDSAGAAGSPRRAEDREAI
jgi:hypothetical protein